MGQELTVAICQPLEQINDLERAKRLAQKPVSPALRVSAVVVSEPVSRITVRARSSTVRSAAGKE
jgi:hypothetical protein